MNELLECKQELEIWYAAMWEYWKNYRYIKLQYWNKNKPFAILLFLIIWVNSSN